MIFLAFQSCFIEYHNHNTLEACVYFQLTMELALVQNCIIYSKCFFIFKAIYLCISQLYEHLLTKEYTLDCFQVVTHLWFCSITKLCPTLYPPPLPVVHQPPLSPTISQSLLKFMSVMFSNHFILCHPVLLCLQSLPGSGSFPMSCLLASGGQSSGPSALASVLWMNIQGWLLLELTGLISSWL